jgi:sulfite reductase beta subunit-like hemoprotein
MLTSGSMVRDSITEMRPQRSPSMGKQYLPRKFKIAIAIPPWNDVDVYSNDLDFVAHVDDGQIEGYTIVAS